MTIAAPSAAIAASGADSNLFHQGAAKETDDPEVAAATVKRPDVVRKRPLRSNKALGENADLSSDLDLAGHPKGARPPGEHGPDAGIAETRRPTRRRSPTRKKTSSASANVRRRKRLTSDGRAAANHAVLRPSAPAGLATTRTEIPASR